ncbi:MAG TPA: hypothetical protein P5572_14680, partial [Phycisphaerae bacterium]|nr:hypothetical protein [Phycisphaerae bacterium]
MYRSLCVTRIVVIATLAAPLGAFAASPDPPVVTCSTDAGVVIAGGAAVVVDANISVTGGSGLAAK